MSEPSILPIRLTTLGQLELHNGQGIPVLSVLAQPKRAALFVYLVTARPRREHQREELLALLWGERDADSARRALRQALYFLRTSLGRDVIATRGDESVGVPRERVWCDAELLAEHVEAQRLADALDLYSGEFLPAFHVDDAPEFEKWLDAERVHLHAVAADAARRLGDLRERSGDLAGAIAAASRAVELSPADEQPTQRLMRLYTAAGDRSAAWREYEGLRDRLWREYELRPSAETNALAAGLRTQSEQDDRGDPTETGQIGGAVEAAPGTPVIVPAHALDASHGSLSTEALHDSPAEAQKTTARRVRRAVYVAVAGVIVFVAATESLEARREASARDLLQDARTLIDDGQHAAAYRLLQEAELRIPGDSALHGLLVETTMHIRVSSTPAGARIEVRDFLDSEDQFQALGTTPVPPTRLPYGMKVWRITLPGAAPQQRLTTFERSSFHFELTASAPAGMTAMDGLRRAMVTVEPVELSPWLLDTRETTNAEYARFLRAGGYGQPQHWSSLLSASPEGVSLERAQHYMRDRTGLPGPATWSDGTYRAEEADHPVLGISWYEADAYCRWAGKRLPTVHHWTQAAGFVQTMFVVRFSNFASGGAVAVGGAQTIGPYGTYDMAGNAKEWTWNESVDERRYIMGGSWNEPAYMFTEFDAQLPTLREPTFGVRCARYAEDESDPAQAAAPPRTVRPGTDLVLESLQRPPVSDSTFDYLRSRYDNANYPLEPRLESASLFPEWTLERVSFAAGYAGERVPAVLYLPRGVPPPYQVVIYFPGAGAFEKFEPFGDGESQRQFFLFLVRSGRAVMFPMYRGSFERWQVASFEPPEAWRDLIVFAGRDIKRSVDYVASRPDIDETRLAYMGLSLGSTVAPIMTVVEPRFRVSVLLSGGFYLTRRLPEVDPVHFLPRVRVPTLMFNGCHDWGFDYELSQTPFFDLLGAAEKRHRVVPEGHVPVSREEFHLEALEWLDRHLGPVSGRGVAQGAPQDPGRCPARPSR